METLTAPKIETIQPQHDIAMQVDGIHVAYHQRAGARRTEYGENASAVLDGKEAGSEAQLGTFEMGDVSLPVVAKFTVENKPEPYARDASPESEFVIVDIRGLGMADTIGTSVSGFKQSVDIVHRFGAFDRSDSAPQYALVDLTAIKRRSEKGGSPFAITTISRDPERPTTIRRDFTLHGEATAADGLAGIGRDNITITSDADGKIIVSTGEGSSAASESRAMTIDANTEPLTGYEPQFAAGAEMDQYTERLTRRRKHLGKTALLFEARLNNDAKIAEHMAQMRRDAQVGFGVSDKSDEYEVGEPIWLREGTPAPNQRADRMSAPLRTEQDVQTRIRDLREAGVSDKDIKKGLLKDLHPDFNPGVDPELAKIVTNEFRPKPQEYRDEQPVPQPAYAEQASTDSTTSASASSEETVAPTTPVSEPSTQVVPASVPTQQPQPTPSEFTQAA